MAEVDNNFLAEMLRELRGDIARLGRNDVTRDLRQTATEHFEQGLLAHVASIHSAIDELKDDVRQIKRRLDLVDAE